MNAHAKITVDRDVAEEVHALAAKAGVVYSRGPLDQWAETVTALAGDDVVLDEVEGLLIGLRQAGVITARQATALSFRVLGSSEYLVQSAK